MGEPAEIPIHAWFKSTNAPKAIHQVAERCEARVPRARGTRIGRGRGVTDQRGIIADQAQLLGKVCVARI